jgi:lysophospholipase L1-like esterase
MLTTLFRLPRLLRTLLASALALVFAAWICAEARWPIRAARLKAKSLAQVPPEDLANLKLYLPRTLYAYPGLELKVCFENFVPPSLFRQLAFQVNCPQGTVSRRYWSATFTPEQAGAHPWELIVTDLAGKERARGKCQVHVAPANAGAGKKLRMLIVGDSLTHATFYPNRLSELCGTSGNPRLEMIGTHKPSSVAPGVAHEGYNGWTWLRFVSFYSPGTFLMGTPDRSPFVFLDAAQQPQLDVARYLRENSPAGPPDLVVFQIGINDVFGDVSSDGYLFTPELDGITPNIERLLTAFREALPEASLAIWLPQPVNATQASFDASYDEVQALRGIQRNKFATRQHWLVEHMINRYGDREKEGLYLVPICATVDPLDDFDANDSVHPSVAGYRRIGENVYAWLKCWLAENPQIAARLPAAETEPSNVASAPTSPTR